jgi:hypothetical protein
MFNCLFLKVKNGFSFIYPLYSKYRYFKIGYSVHYDITPIVLYWNLRTQIIIQELLLR